MAIDIVALGKGQRSPECVGKLLDVWEASVRATHHFLTEKDIVRLAPQAEEALRHIETLWVLQDGQSPVGFMGVQPYLCRNSNGKINTLNEKGNFIINGDNYQYSRNYGSRKYFTNVGNG